MLKSGDNRCYATFFTNHGPPVQNLSTTQNLQPLRLGKTTRPHWPKQDGKTSQINSQYNNNGPSALKLKPKPCVVNRRQVLGPIWPKTQQNYTKPKIRQSSSPSNNQTQPRGHKTTTSHIARHQATDSASSSSQGLTPIFTALPRTPTLWGSVPVTAFS